MGGRQRSSLQAVLKGHPFFMRAGSRKEAKESGFAFRVAKDGLEFRRLKRIGSLVSDLLMPSGRCLSIDPGPAQNDGLWIRLETPFIVVKLLH